jgi:Zn-dependent peptidase ImmA (M78 family)
VKTERWCNAVAAEILVPLEALEEDVHDVPIEQGALSEMLQRLARRFKVSTLVILRRLFDAERIDRDTLDIAWQRELDKLAKMARLDSGGDFYNTLGAHVGKRLARAVIVSALEGQTSFTDAFHLLGVRKTQTFYKEAQRLGIYG